MKTFLIAIAVSCFIFPIFAAEQNQKAALGCVAYKRGTDAWAAVLEYQSYRDFGSSVTVIDRAGEEVRVFHGQEPIFIPYPSDDSADPQAVNALINQARKRYPELAPRLAAIEKAWASVPRKSAVAVAPAPVVQKPPSQPKTGMEIVTVTGKKFENVTISKVEPDGLMVMTDAGVEKIPFVTLPPEIQKKYGYNPEAAAAFTAALAVAQKENAMRAQQVREEEQRKVMVQAKAEEARRVAEAEEAAKAPKILRDAQGQIVTATPGQIATNAFTLENCVVQIPLSSFRQPEVQEVAAGVFKVELQNKGVGFKVISGTATREQVAWLLEASKIWNRPDQSSVFVLISEAKKYSTTIQFLGNKDTGAGFAWKFESTR